LGKKGKKNLLNGLGHSYIINNINSINLNLNTIKQRIHDQCFQTQKLLLKKKVFPPKKKFFFFFLGGGGWGPPPPPPPPPGSAPGFVSLDLIYISYTKVFFEEII
jgi:hypothetical protein